jgi:murein DD-endopeptidase MepM/ murein hydrolase activator NlpD
LHSIKITETLIKNLRQYSLAALSIVVFAYIIMLNFAAYTVKVTLDKHSLKNDLTAASQRIQYFDSYQFEHKLNRIDNNLSMIDGYLQNRGILRLENAGGELETEKTESNTNKVLLFEKQSDIFLTSLQDLPIGYPYYGVKSSDYGYRRNPFGGFSSEFHNGVDIKGPVGDPIYATGDGIVNRCDRYSGYGNAVVIDHKSGYQSLYGHLSSVNVVQGQEVKAGDVIGFLGSTGRSTGPHVHYEIRKDGEDISPEPFLRVF